MNKNILIIGAVVILLAAGAAFMVMGQSKTPEQPTPGTVADTTQNTGSGIKKQSLKDLMRQAGSHQCTFADAGGASSGAVHSAGGKFRGDFTSTINGQSSVSHMISDGQDMYLWIGEEKTGMKMSMTAIESAGAGNTTVQKTVDINKQVDYSCSPWTADVSRFTVPADVTFSDLSGMMPGAGAGGALPSGISLPDTQSACAACDSLPAESQAQCKAALQCN